MPYVTGPGRVLAASPGVLGPFASSQVPVRAHDH